MASAPTACACLANLTAVGTSKACTPNTTAGFTFLPAEATASMPSRRSRSLSVSHSLTICGHTNPCTRPRSRNRNSSTRTFRSSLLSVVNGVCVIGKMPRSGFAPGF